MKVVQISPTFFGKDSVVGGGERYALELSRRLSRYAEVTFVTFSRRLDRTLVEREGDLEIRRYPVKTFLNGNTANPVSFAFLKDLSSFDVLHCFGHPQVVTDLCIAYARIYRKKLFVTDIGGGGACLSTYLSKVGIDTRRFINGFLLLSVYSAQSYMRYSERSQVIHGGVDTDSFRPLDIPRDRRVLFVGRLISAKGINYLLDAIDSATPLRVVGQPYDEGYFRLLQNLAQGKTVEFLTGVSDGDLVRQYSSAMVTAVPSVYTDVYGNSAPGELLNLVALESMACGTPVIATRCGALPEVVEDGVTGFLVPPGDPRALREKIGFLLDRPEAARVMGDAGRERVLHKFTWDRVATLCLHAYRKAVESKSWAD
jgi:glycosyltransferase involved in cell wall biosynthesis